MTAWAELTHPGDISFNVHLQCMVKNALRSIYQYPTMAPRFQDKITNVLKLYLSFNSQKRLGCKETPPNIEVGSESLGAMLEYQSTEHGF